MYADDAKVPPDDVQPFSPADNEHSEGSSDEDDEEETEVVDTRRVRRSDDIAMLDNDDDLDAGDATLLLDAQRVTCFPAQLFRPLMHHS